MVVKTQADFSIYQATHIHSDSDYESQLSRVQELEHVSEGPSVFVFVVERITTCYSHICMDPSP